MAHDCKEHHRGVRTSVIFAAAPGPKLIYELDNTDDTSTSTCATGTGMIVQRPSLFEVKTVSTLGLQLPEKDVWRQLKRNLHRLYIGPI